MCFSQSNNHQTKRYRITGIGGQFWDYEGNARFIVSYSGVLLKKDGTLGESTDNVYAIVKVYDFEDRA